MATINVGRVRPVAQGDYNPATEYAFFDFVYYQGSSYIALQTVPAGNTPPVTETTDGNGVTTVTPISNAFWAVMARAGSTTGVIGPQGPQGEQGQKGDKGDTGDVGLTGATGQVGPTGEQGPAGADGQAASVVVGTVTTGPAGSNANVTNRGTTNAATLDFLIPRGDTGATGATGSEGPRGPQGIQGPQGPQGSAANLLAADSRGSNNVAVGPNCGAGLTGKSNSVAIGFNSMNTLNQGASSSVAVGYNTMQSAFGASSITAVGYNAGQGVSNKQGSTAIGYNAAISASNQITLGNSSITSLRCNVTTISGVSDERDKEEIDDLQLGLSLVEALRPVSFRWNKRYLSEAEEMDGHAFQGQRAIGFIAQDLASIEDSIEDGRQLLKFVNREQEDRWRTNEAAMIPVLVKAIQQLSARVAELEK